MQYTPRDLRAARLFSIVLIAFSVALLIAGAIIFTTQSEPSPAAGMNASGAKLALKGKSSLPPGVGFVVCGFTLGCLAAALSFKVRQLVRTGGIEPADLQTPLDNPPSK